MKTAKPFKKHIRAWISFILSVLLITVNLPFTAMAVIDDYFEDGNLSYIITSEGSGDTEGTVTALFNENVDPETVTSIVVPDTVQYDSKSYSVTGLLNNAFGSCTALESLDLSECTELASIGMGAFIDCESLTSITVPCNFDKDLFQDTGVVPDGDSFTIEYASFGEGSQSGIVEVSSGTFSYIHGDWEKDINNPDQHKCSRCNATEAHNWKVNDKNYAEHICTKCSAKEKHTWKPDASNSAQHKCTVCQYAENHYGGTANCEGKAICTACKNEYSKAGGRKGHEWMVLSSTIGATTAEYVCNECKQTTVQEIGVGESSAGFNGQKLKTILQDPYKVLPEGVGLKVKSVEPGTPRYNELLAQLDDTHKVENLAFFEIELYNAKGEKISGEIAGKVRILMQIPNGWDKKDLEAVLVMAGADVEFEESVITIDGIDYLALWTDHFSPYAMIDTVSANDSASTQKKSPATGNQDVELITALATASLSAAVICIITFKRKRKTS